MTDEEPKNMRCKSQVDGLFFRYCILYRVHTKDTKKHESCTMIFRLYVCLMGKQQKGVFREHIPF